MRRLATVWLYRGGAYTDLTATSTTGMSLSLQDGDKLYFGHDDWLSGVLFFLSQPLPDTATPVYSIEAWTGDDWARLEQERSFEALRFDYRWSTAWRFQGHGALYWGDVPNPHHPSIADSSFPEATAPPAMVTRYWYRLLVQSAGGSVTVDKVYALPYNTYTNVVEVARFLSLPPFTDTSSPDADTMRRFIRAQEDWLDNYCRMSWRMRSMFAEAADFNPYGIRPRRQPVQAVTRLGLWNGTAFDVLEQGRGGGGQYFLDRERGMIYFTLPSFRLRYYSFLLSRYLRQPASVVFDYIYGDDFDVSPQREDVRFIVNRMVGYELVVSSDETGIFSSGLEVLSKREKAEEWRTSAMERAEFLRRIYATGLGAAIF